MDTLSTAGCCAVVDAVCGGAVLIVRICFEGVDGDGDGDGVAEGALVVLENIDDRVSFSPTARPKNSFVRK